MTLLIDRARGPNTIHVLIVGVGCHDGGKPRSIAGMGETVRRLYDWWRLDGSLRCLPGWSLGTVEVLASAEAAVVLSGDRGEEPATPPIFDNVKIALNGWRERAVAGGMGFLHWSGHGAMVGLDSGLAVQALLCQNRRDDGGVDGIDWHQTLAWLNVTCGDSKISCFIDACRSPDGEGWNYRRVDDGYKHGATTNPAFVHYTTVEGDVAWSYADAIPGADFPGGPIGTHAVHDAIDRYAAHRISNVDGFGASPDLIVNATYHRMRRISSRIDELGPNWKPGPLGSFPTWFSTPVMAMPHPFVMIDVAPPEGRTIADFDCLLQHGNIHGPFITDVGPDYFEGSVPYDDGPYFAELVDNSSTAGTGVYRTKFPVKQPCEKVRFDGGVGR